MLENIVTFFSKPWLIIFKILQPKMESGNLVRNVLPDPGTSLWNLHRQLSDILPYMRRHNTYHPKCTIDPQAVVLWRSCEFCKLLGHLTVTEKNKTNKNKTLQLHAILSWVCHIMSYQSSRTMALGWGRKQHKTLTFLLFGMFYRKKYVSATLISCTYLNRIIAFLTF